MVLITATFDNITVRLSVEPCALENFWHPWVTSLDNVSFQMDTPNGGIDIVEWGSISLSQAMFRDSEYGFMWPPSMTGSVKIEYTTDTESNAITLVDNAIAHYNNMTEEDVSYDLFITDDEDADLLKLTSDIVSSRTTTDINGDDVVIPCAIGEVEHQLPLRLNDYSGGACYHNGYIVGVLHTDWHIYDDGVDICSSCSIGTISTTGAYTFYLNYAAVGEISISGPGSHIDNTSDVYDAVLAIAAISAGGASGQHSGFRTGSANVGFWVAQQISGKKLISKICASYGHMIGKRGTTWFGLSLESEGLGDGPEFKDIEVLPCGYENDEGPVHIVKTSWPRRHSVEEGGQVFVKKTTSEISMNSSIFWNGTTSGVGTCKLIDSTGTFLSAPEESSGGDMLRPNMIVKNVTDKTTTTVTAVQDDTEILIEDDIFTAGELYEIGYQFQYGSEVTAESYSIDGATNKDNIKHTINFRHLRKYKISIPMQEKPELKYMDKVTVTERHRFAKNITLTHNKIIGVIYDFQNEVIVYTIAGTAYESPQTSSPPWDPYWMDLVVAAGGEDGYWSWFTAGCFIRGGADEGLILLATGSKIYKQNLSGTGNYSADPNWDIVGSIGYNMDPCFIKTSPDGSKVAFGTGYGLPLLIFPIALLDKISQPVLHDGTDPMVGVTSYNANYYDGAWADNQYLLVNGGQWPIDEGSDGASGVGSIDTDNPFDTGTLIITGIPGASASVAVDNSGNLISGVGFTSWATGRTGEINLWTPSEWSVTQSIPIDYAATPRNLAQNVLSAAYLDANGDNSIIVGGGNTFGGLNYGNDPEESGFAARIDNIVVTRVANPSGPGFPVNEADAAEYEEFAPDPCTNDSATGIFYGNGGDLAVIWNPSNQFCNENSANEYWNAGFIPRLTAFR